LKIWLHPIPGERGGELSTFTTAILCVGLYKAASAVESTFTHLTVEPDFTVMLAGSNPVLLILMVLSDTEGVFCRVGVAVTFGISVVSGSVVMVAVGWGGVDDWVHPQAITRIAVMARRTRPFFIN